MIEVDARGLSCPIPVVKTKEVIDKTPNVPFVVIVDNEVSKENVTRFAKSRGYLVEVEAIEDGLRLLLSPLAK